MGTGKLKSREETYFTTVSGMCRHCRKIVPARITFEDNHVYQQSICADCGMGKRTLIAFDKEGYLDSMRQMCEDEAPLKHASPQKRGCPHDCGPCAGHGSKCRLPVFSITNSCNMKCNHCFTYNRADKRYDMSLEEMAQTLETMLKHAGGRVDLVNITGGEPTLHPQLFEMIELCQRPEIGRVTLNSNGIRMAEDFEFCKALAQRNIYIVLSLNEFDDEKLTFFHPKSGVGAMKRKALQNLIDAGVKLTLLNVLSRDVNLSFSGELIDLMLSHDVILNLNFQTLTYTGQGGGRLTECAQIPVDEAVEMIVSYSKNRLAKEDFTPRSHAHFLCYRVCYMLRYQEKLIPFKRFMTESELQQFTAEGYLLHAENAKNFFQDLIHRLYAENEDELCSIFRQLFQELFPNEFLSETERQRRAEKYIRAIHIHAHMDEDNLDLSRLCSCPDQVPTPDGKMISACAYNLFYRMKDENFYEHS